MTLTVIIWTCSKCIVGNSHIKNCKNDQICHVFLIVWSTFHSCIYVTVSALGEESLQLDGTSQGSSSQRTSLGVFDEIHAGDNVSLTSSSSDPIGAEQNGMTCFQFSFQLGWKKSSKTASKTQCWGLKEWMAHINVTDWQSPRQWYVVVCSQ